MIFESNLISIIIVCLLLGVTFYNFSFLKDNKAIYVHKNFLNTNLKPVFSGGIILLFNLVLFIKFSDISYYLFFFVIFLLGFFSDIDKIKSPKLRIIVQVIIIFFLVNYLEIYIYSIRIDLIDQILKIQIFKIFFSTICLLIIINGTNFMDGVNGLVIGYYFIISFILFYLISENSLSFEEIEILESIIIILACLYILNIFEILYLGDNGSYLISLIVGVLLVKFYQQNPNISPYYVVNLLWYPAYENLFSIIRKVKKGKSAYKPDSQHLHHLIYIFLKKKYKKNKYLNSLTGLILNLLNLSIIMLASIEYENTKYQICLIVLSLITYNFFYFKLSQFKKY